MGAAMVHSRCAGKDVTWYLSLDGNTSSAMQKISAHPSRLLQGQAPPIPWRGGKRGGPSEPPRLPTCPTPRLEAAPLRTLLFFPSVSRKPRLRFLNQNSVLFCQRIVKVCKYCTCVRVSSMWVTSSLIKTHRCVSSCIILCNT